MSSAVHVAISILEYLEANLQFYSARCYSLHMYLSESSQEDFHNLGSNTLELKNYKFF